VSKQTMFFKICAAFGVASIATQAALGAVTADEAKKLGTTLTEWGAEKGANADGSIPAYTGGLTKPPAGWTKGADQYVDPYKDDKPLYAIDAKNAAQYEALLGPGDKAMLAAHPTFKINVYPTRRSVAYPSWVLENTVKNATTAKLVGDVEGDSLSGAAPDGLPFPGVPFPIPKTGYEVMWNHHMGIAPAAIHQFSQAFLIDSSGSVSPLPQPDEYFLKPWYDKSGKLRKETYDAVFGFSAKLMTPPSSAGVHFLNYYLPKITEGAPQKVWFYTPGQRRVRAAPEFSYDIPIAAYGGVLFWDEIFGFVGRMDRFNFKLVGKKEMIVPYNVFGVTNQVLAKDFVGPKHVAPDAVRWEKRRVWVVETTRKENARHAYSRRTFYVEEDCTCIVAVDAYDNGGKLWRVSKVYTFPTYDTGGVSNATWSYNDLIKGNYTVINAGHKDAGHFIRAYASGDDLPGMELTPQAVANGSVR
jgi:hypothetical protein